MKCIDQRIGAMDGQTKQQRSPNGSPCCAACHPNGDVKEKCKRSGQKNRYQERGQVWPAR